MSPTVFTESGYRFLFFSREEPRIHVHVQCSRGEAKFWIEPKLELARNKGLSAQELRNIEKIIGAHINDIKNAWYRHFLD